MEPVKLISRTPVSHCGPPFPLYVKAEKAGALTSGNCLIVAPTATGKSYIGRTILEEAVRRKEPGVHAYLVPYRALAAEMYDSFIRETEQKDIRCRVKISTGDHKDPFYPGDTDILVATFETFSALLSSPDLRVGRVVVDEIHLLADESRGPALEGLLVRLKTWRKPKSLCALSAVVSNPEELAGWLEVPLILGSTEDRSVRVEFRCEVEEDIPGRLAREVELILKAGEQAIIFCRSKAASQKVSRELSEVVMPFLTEEDKRALREIAYRSTDDEEEAAELAELMSDGVTYHHAGLSRDGRKAVETAFRQRHLKVISCTPTLAAGVNLPARLVVVSDVYRTEFVRGRPRNVVLSTGELLNMLGRAGRPGQVDAGTGLALMEPKVMKPTEIETMQLAIRDGTGNPVTSRLPDSFDALMRFILSVICDRGEATLENITGAVEASLWYYQDPRPLSFDRPVQADIMEDIPSFARARGLEVTNVGVIPDGVAGSVVSGGNVYEFSLKVSGLDCSCPAKTKYYPWEVCKHLACAINTLLFSDDVDEEVRNRALYVSAHLFTRTLDVGTKIQVALRLLKAWGLVEDIAGGFAPTKVGEIAARSGLDMLLLRTARDRLIACSNTPPADEAASWLVEDFFSEEKKRQKWLSAIRQWIRETPEDKMKLPEKYRGDFERQLEQLRELAMVYSEIARALGKRDLSKAFRTAGGCILYGVAPELVPLAALRIRGLGRARCRFLHDQRGIKSLEDLAAADPKRLAGSTVPHAYAAAWVERAREMLKSRRAVSVSPSDAQKDQIDEFLASFGADRLMFENA